MSEDSGVVQSPERMAAVEAAEAASEVVAAVGAAENAGGRPDRTWFSPPVEKLETSLLRSTSEFASGVHSYINDYIRLADQNAAFLFAAVGATLAFLNARGVTKLWIKDPITWSLSEGLAFFAVVGLLASATASAIVLLPRKKGSRTGLVSWGAISKCRSADEYARLVWATEAPKLTEAKLEHCFELSRVCRHKYNALAWGLWSGGIGFVATLLHLALT